MSRGTRAVRQAAQIALAVACAALTTACPRGGDGPRPVAPKVVRGTNVRNVLDLVARGEADEGIVYATDVPVSKDVDVVAEVPARARPNVRYPVYVANAARADERAVADFLCAPAAKTALASHGFLDHPP